MASRDSSPIFYAGILILMAIWTPFILSLSLFCMPLLLILSTAFNLNIEWLNKFYENAKLTTLPWWNILYGILSLIGILPSYILVLPGFISSIIALLLKPIWFVIGALCYTAFNIYISFDPDMTILTPILEPIYTLLKWIYCDIL